jgi:hypothetical protein
MLHVRITNYHGMQDFLAEPFISQDSEKLRFQKSRNPQVDECLQQISRILCPAPEGGAVSPRRIATPIHPRVRIFPSHLSIRPDSLIPEMPSTLSRPYLKRH